MTASGIFWLSYSITALIVLAWLLAGFDIAFAIPSTVVMLIAAVLMALPRRGNRRTMAELLRDFNASKRRD